jgi:hypothetical protein
MPRSFTARTGEKDDFERAGVTLYAFRTKQ